MLSPQREKCDCCLYKCVAKLGRVISWVILSRAYIFMQHVSIIAWKGESFLNRKSGGVDGTIDANGEHLTNYLPISPIITCGHVKNDWKKFFSASDCGVEIMSLCIRTLGYMQFRPVQRAAAAAASSNYAPCIISQSLLIGRVNQRLDSLTPTNSINPSYC